MKLKLLLVFIGVLVILLMAGLEIVQGEDTYPVDVGYPVTGYPVYTGYPVDYGYPVPIDYGYPEPAYPSPIDEGYPVYVPVPVVGYPVELEAVNYPVIPDSSIEPSINPVQLETIKPQYRNGRNLWQEIVFQFSELLRLIK